jgi:D-amino peptidase
MRVAVCADMEGISGIDRVEQCFPSWTAEYRQGVRLLVAEVRAAVRAALETGAREVVLADWHYFGRNIPRSAFPDLPIRRLWSGGRPLIGAHALGRPDAAVLVGIHAGAGNSRGFLSHTFWRGMAVLLDGKAVPEAVLWALALGAGGVPVAVLAGDQQAGEEARELLPGVRTVAVKAGVSRTRTILRPAADAREELAEAIRGAMVDLPPPLTHPFPAEATVRYARRSWAALAVRRGVGDRLGERDVAARLGSVHDLGPFLARALLATPGGAAPAVVNAMLPSADTRGTTAWNSTVLALAGRFERRAIRAWARERADLYPAVGSGS